MFPAATEWPRDEVSLEDNVGDLERHEKEFHERYAFEYTVLTPDSTTCLGCVYLEPSSDPDMGCAVYLRVRDSHVVLDEALFATVKQWLVDAWPFKRIAYPGREAL